MIDEIGLVQRRLEEEGEKMLAFFEGLPGADWAQTVYVDGSGWTVRSSEGSEGGEEAGG
jgi:hypothetical protein